MISPRAIMRSSIITFIFLTIITIWAEISEKFKDLLKGMTGHHWITKSILAIALFLILSFLISKQPKKNHDIQKEAIALIITAIAAALILLGFFTWHFFS